MRAVTLGLASCVPARAVANTRSCLPLRRPCSSVLPVEGAHLCRALRCEYRAAQRFVLRKYRACSNDPCLLVFVRQCPVTRSSCARSENVRVPRVAPQSAFLVRLPAHATARTLGFSSTSDVGPCKDCIALGQSEARYCPRPVWPLVAPKEGRDRNNRAGKNTSAAGGGGGGRR